MTATVEAVSEDAAIIDEAEQLRAELASTKRMVKLLMGQARSTVQALAGLVDFLDGLEQRLNHTAEEAQHAHEEDHSRR